MMILGNHLCSKACCGGGLGSLGHQRHMEVLLAGTYLQNTFYVPLVLCLQGEF